jgi:hypothetical protein
MLRRVWYLLTRIEVASLLLLVLGSVFLVPLLGIPKTCVAIGLVGLAGLLALV